MTPKERAERLFSGLAIEGYHMPRKCKIVITQAIEDAVEEEKERGNLWRDRTSELAKRIADMLDLVAQEREACAKVAEDHPCKGQFCHCPKVIAQTIRSRK